MDNFLGRIRSGAGKAAFEADKLRRVTGVQNIVNGLKKEVEKAYCQVGRVAYGLYGDGRITQPELKAACDQLAALQAKIAEHEQEIATIRAEEFSEPQAFVSPQYGRLCPNGHGPIAPQDNFCQTCGAKAVFVPSPTPVVGTAVCQNCGTPLAADARFCAGCGQPTPEPAPVPEPVVTSAACTACGEALLPGAVFCAECGHRTPPDEVTEPETTKPETEALDRETAVSEEPTVNNDVEETDTVEETDEPETDWLDESTLGPAVEEPRAAENEAISAITPTESEVSACHNCDAPLLSDAAFCAECGYQIEAEEE